MVAKQAPLVLIIRDGWGQHPLTPDATTDAYNAIVQATTPVADMLNIEWLVSDSFSFWVTNIYCWFLMLLVLLFF